MTTHSRTSSYDSLPVTSSVRRLVSDTISISNGPTVGAPPPLPLTTTSRRVSRAGSSSNSSDRSSNNSRGKRESRLGRTVSWNDIARRNHQQQNQQVPQTHPGAHVVDRKYSLQPQAPGSGPIDLTTTEKGDSSRIAVPAPIGHQRRPALTIWSSFKHIVLNHSEALALSGIERGVDVNYSWAQYYEQVLTLAKVLVFLGLEPGQGAVISSRSSTHLYMLNMAVVAVGGVVAHIRPTWNADELVDHILPDANASVLIVDKLTPNFKRAMQQSHRPLRAVLVLGSDPTADVTLSTRVLVLHMDDLEQLAQTAPDVAVELLTPQNVTGACCLMTFGYDGQGQVRATCLSHENVMFTAATLADCFGPLTTTDRMVGYIPLYHVAAQILEVYMPLVCGMSVICAPSYRDSLVQVITGRKPTIFFATPDTWAHFSNQVYRAKSEVNSFLYRWAKTRATHNSKKLLYGQDAHRSLGYMLAKGLVLNNIKKKIGLESCHACYSVLAPLDFELEKLFKIIDLPIYSLFGTAETSGFAAINFPHACEFGSSGRALPSTKIWCEEQTQEVLLRGRNVGLGYVQNGQYVPFTKSNSWFRFGLSGHLTPNGFLTVNDPRSFLVLSTGDWAPTEPFEASLMEMQPELARAVLVGSGRTFLSVMLFLKTVVGPSRTANKSAVLANDALAVGQSVGSRATTVAEAIKCQRWAIHFDDVLDALRVKCTLSGFSVRKWILMAENFTVESGELDPDTLEVKRKAVDSKYQSLLDSLYT